MIRNVTFHSVQVHLCETALAFQERVSLPRAPQKTSTWHPDRHSTAAANASHQGDGERTW